MIYKDFAKIEDGHHLKLERQLYNRFYKCTNCGAKYIECRDIDWWDGDLKAVNCETMFLLDALE